MTLDEFKSIGDKYNLFYNKEMLFFRPDFSRAQYAVAFYYTGIAQVYTKCDINDNYEIETIGDCNEAENVNYFEKYIKEFWINYKNKFVSLKKIIISKDFENDNKA